MQRNCKECEGTFEVERGWQIFCCKACSIRFNKRFKEICFYCGQYGDHKDHVQPRTETLTKGFAGKELVYACAECNTSLSNHLFLDIVDRIECLIHKYQRKYNLIKPAVQWDEDELKALGASLRRKVVRKIKKRKKNEDRIIYLGFMKQEMLLNVENPTDF